MMLSLNVNRLEKMGANLMPAKILVVDDHDGVRRAVREWLEMALPQCDIVEARSGEEAVAMAQATAPRVVLVDIGLPEMNGFEALRRIKAIAPSVQGIMFSMLEGEAYRADAFVAGASVYVPKRLICAELVPTIKALLSGASPQPSSPAKKQVESRFPVKTVKLS